MHTSIKESRHIHFDHLSLFSETRRVTSSKKEMTEESGQMVDLGDKLLTICDAAVHLLSSAE